MKEHNSDLLEAILLSACEVFNNLNIQTISQKLSLGDTLEENQSLTTFEISKKEETYIFPAIGGKINIEDAIFDKVDTLAFNEKYSALREENLVTNPLKILVGSQSWSANLVVLGKSASKVDKVAVLENDIWQLDPAFMDLIKKVSNYGSTNEGGIKLCSGITVDEYKCFKTSGVKCFIKKRVYPGGSFVYEGPNCSRLIEIYNNSKLPNYLFHRCKNCQSFIRRHSRHCEETIPPAPKKECTDNEKTCLASAVVESPPPVTTPSSISSKIPITFLTPTARRKRLLNLKKKRIAQKNEILRLRKRIAKYEVNLHDEQSEQLEEIVSKIDSEFSGDHEEILQENPKTIIKTEVD